jgi:hypothetical protein
LLLIGCDLGTSLDILKSWFRPWLRRFGRRFHAAHTIRHIGLNGLLFGTLLLSRHWLLQSFIHLKLGQLGLRYIQTGTMVPFERGLHTEHIILAFLLVAECDILVVGVHPVPLEAFHILIKFQYLLLLVLLPELD